MLVWHLLETLAVLGAILSVLCLKQMSKFPWRDHGAWNQKGRLWNWESAEARDSVINTRALTFVGKK